MSESMTDTEALELIRTTMRDLENWRISFAFKRMKLKYMREATTNLMKACIAFHLYGLPVTTDLMGALLEIQGRSRLALSSRLHNLGDKHCLTLKRGRPRRHGAIHEWVVNPVFLEAYR